jgi:glycosyltransferase involved in cell wall biosynthesis
VCRSRAYRLARWTTKHVVRRVICISQTTANDIRRRWRVPHSHLDVVPLGTPFALRRGMPRPPESEDALTLASPYNLEPRKNLPGLLEAIPQISARHPAVRLILFGRAAVTAQREEAFLRRVHELGISDQVVRTGFLPDEELMQLYQRSTLFVFPSLYEGFGLPVLEAMGGGACVVARRASAMAEVVGDAGALVETGDPDQLAQCLGDLLDSPQRRQALGRAARQRAAMFTLERMARLTFRSYLRALGRKRLFA